MKLSFNILSTKNLRTFLQVSIVTNLGLLCVLLVLSYRVVRQDTHVILMPQYDLNRRVSVSRHQVSDEYVKDWVQGILSNLLNVSPETVEPRFKEVMQLISPKYAGQVRAFWEKEVSRLQRSKVSTVFYPQEFVVDQDKKTIAITGVLHSWFASDHKPVVETKSYTITWEQHENGLIMLAGIHLDGSEDV